MKTHICQFCQQDCVIMNDSNSWLKCNSCQVEYGFGDLDKEDTVKMIIYQTKIEDKLFEVIVNFKLNHMQIWKCIDAKIPSQERHWLFLNIIYTAPIDITPINIFSKLKMYLIFS